MCIIDSLPGEKMPELEAVKLHVKPCWYGTAHGELVIMQRDTKPGRRQPNDTWFVPEYVAYRTTFYSKLQQAFVNHESSQLGTECIAYFSINCYHIYLKRLRKNIGNLLHLLLDDSSQVSAE